MPDIKGLTSFVQSQAGTDLRAIGEFDVIQTELHFVRDDLDSQEIRERLNAIHDTITWSWAPPENGVEEELGPKAASLQVHDRAVIIHLPTGDDQGILIGLEPEAATDLTTFLDDCLGYTQTTERSR